MFWKILFCLNIYAFGYELFHLNFNFESLDLIYKVLFANIFMLYAYINIINIVSLWGLGWQKKLLVPKFWKINFLLCIVPFVLISMGDFILFLLFNTIDFISVVNTIANTFIVFLSGVGFYKYSFKFNEIDFAKTNNPMKTILKYVILAITVIGILIPAELSPVYNYHKLIDKASNFITSQNYDEAIKVYNEAIFQYPEYNEAYMQLANYYQKTNQIDLAILHYNKAIQADKTNLNAYYSLGTLFTDLKQIDKAINVYNKGIKAIPGNKSLYSQLGQIYYDNGNIEEALNVYQKAKSELAINLLNIAILKNLGRYDKALKFANELKNQKSSEICEFQNSYNKKLGCELTNSFVSLISPTDFDNEYNANIGRIYLLKGNYDKALEYFKKSISKNNKSYDIYSFLGRVYIEKGEYEKALNYLNKSFSIDSNQNYLVFINFGYLYYKKGEIQKAEKFYQKAMSIAPNRFEVLLENGKFYASQGKYNEAIKLFEKGNSIQKYNYEANYNLGIIYLKIGKKELAKKYLNKALFFKPDNSDEIKKYL